MYTCPRVLWNSWRAEAGFRDQSENDTPEGGDGDRQNVFIRCVVMVPLRCGNPLCSLHPIANPMDYLLSLGRTTPRKAGTEGASLRADEVVNDACMGTVVTVASSAILPKTNRDIY